jgi:hypothetical protein
MRSQFRRLNRTVRSLFHDPEILRPVSECDFDWTCAYRISEAPGCRIQVELRLRLDPGSTIRSVELGDSSAVWKSAIENAWTGQHLIRRKEGQCPCESYLVTVAVHFVDSGEHHSVRIWSGSGPANVTNWHITRTGQTTAHEAGHMFGYPDEYSAEECPDRIVFHDGTIMGASRIGTVRPRHYRDFADWISIETGCEYEVVE